MSETHAKVILVILSLTIIPLTCLQIFSLLKGIVPLLEINEWCEALRRDGILCYWCGEYYMLKKRESEMRVNCLVTSEFQKLGMSILEVSNRKWMIYIPPEAEHRFFEPRTSTIAPSAGLGLFLRANRAIRQGTIICEYRGNHLTRTRKNMEHSIYTIHLRATNSFIDGIDEQGHLLSLATLINDNGPQSKNASFFEFENFPGRVFVVSDCDLNPNEEIFTTYGPNYWGFESYDAIAELHQKNQTQETGPNTSISSNKWVSTKKEVKQSQSLRIAHKGIKKTALNNHSKSIKPAEWLEDFSDDENYLHSDFSLRCRECSTEYMNRLKYLHRFSCQDSLTQLPLMSLSSLPLSDFTAIDSSSSHIGITKPSKKHRSSLFVDVTDPLTFALTYEDMLEGIETFAEWENFVNSC